MSPLSRNFSFGHWIGKGFTQKEARLKIDGVVEGLETVKAVKKMAQKYGVEMPIVDAVYSTLFENIQSHTALQNLMGRDLKSE